MLHKYSNFQPPTKKKKKQKTNLEAVETLCCRSCCRHSVGATLLHFSTTWELLI